MRFALFVVFTAFLLFVQGLLGRLTTLAPDLGPILAVYVGLFARRETLAWAITVVALLRSSLDADPLGVQLLVYLLLSGMVDLARDVVFRERLATQVVLSFAAGSVYVVMKWGLAATLPASIGIATPSLMKLAFATLSATLLAPPVFALLRLFRALP
ncbi:MAG: hypothetical protein JNL94_08090 [Planctomycetes bacterium]|nr:hypothetical protein [Planctomycetota bacterium]